MNIKYLVMSVSLLAFFSELYTSHYSLVSLQFKLDELIARHDEEWEKIEHNATRLVTPSFADFPHDNKQQLKYFCALRWSADLNPHFKDVTNHGRSQAYFAYAIMYARNIKALLDYYPVPSLSFKSLLNPKVAFSTCTGMIGSYLLPLESSYSAALASAGSLATGAVVQLYNHTKAYKNYLLLKKLYDIKLHVQGRYNYEIGQTEPSYSPYAHYTLNSYIIDTVSSDFAQENENAHIKNVLKYCPHFSPRRFNEKNYSFLNYKKFQEDYGLSKWGKDFAG